MCLGGDAGFVNGHPDNTTSIEEHAEALLMTCLRDTAVVAFRSGFSLEEDPYPMDHDLQEHVHDLLAMALCLSDDVDY